MDDILSYLLELHWKGWRTTSFELQRNGCQLSANQETYRNTMMIAINHPEAHIQGITEQINFYYLKMMHGRRNFQKFPEIVLGVEMMAGRINVMDYSPSIRVGNFGSFQPIDAEPRMVEIRDLSSVAHFQTVQQPKHEVFLKEASMQEILGMALKRQQPMQRDIRQRMIRDREIENIRQGGMLHTSLIIP